MPAQNGAQTVGPARGSAGEGEVWLIPTTKLYDRGATMLPSLLLHARMARPEIWVHPATAAAMGLENNDRVALALGDVTVQVAVCVNDTLPQGVTLVPRSAGIPIIAPRAAKFQRLAEPAVAD